MKWFEHQTDCELNKKFQKLEMVYQAQGGDGFFAAYGRVWRLYEIIGRLGEDRTSTETFDLPPDFSLDLLAFRLKCSMDYLLEFLSILADVGLIDKSAWEHEQRVFAPKLQERADTYTKRKNRQRTASEESSNDVRTLSEETQTKFPPHSHSQTHSQDTQAGACVAGPAAPSGDKLPPKAEGSVSVVQDGGNGSKPKKPVFGPASLMQLWNDLGCRPLVSELTDERRKKAGLRIRKRGDPDWWNRLFKKVKGLNKPWLTFDFLMRNDTNCLKVLESNYDTTSETETTAAKQGQVHRGNGRPGAMTNGLTSMSLRSPTRTDLEVDEEGRARCGDCGEFAVETMVMPLTERRVKRGPYCASWLLPGKIELFITRYIKGLLDGLSQSEISLQKSCHQQS